MNTKFEFVTGDTKTGLTRIRALKDFGIVSKGDLGGYLEKEDNLSSDGNCWVFDNARVSGDARVSCNAVVSGYAMVSGDAGVSDNARVYGNATVFGDACVSGNVRVSGNAWVFGNVRVYGNAGVSDNAWVSGNARVYGNALVSDNALVFDNAWVFDNAKVSGNAKVFGNVRVMAGMRINFEYNKNYPAIITSDGYTMSLDIKNKKICVGCRYFTIPEAIEHWTKTRGDTPLGIERIEHVKYFRYLIEKEACE